MMRPKHRIWIALGIPLALVMMLLIVRLLRESAVPNFREAPTARAISMTRPSISTAATVVPDGPAPAQAALLNAAARGDFGNFENLLQAGAKINGTDEEGKAALHYAAAGGHQQTCERLVQLAAHVNQTDRQGRTPVFYARANGHDGTTAALVRLGANLFLEESPGRQVDQSIRWSVFLKLLVLGMIILSPLWILALIFMLIAAIRRRNAPRNPLARGERIQIEQMAAMLSKMEARAANLETILTHPKGPSVSL